LTNPLGNAIKFTEEGEVVLRIGLVEESESSAVLRLEAKYTGIDMTQE
jgi:two-component system sensor histidine kinase/response regulator